MFQSIIGFIKARWKWGQGVCPACDQKFTRQLQNKNCSICANEWDDLTIWTKWRHSGSLHKAVEATAHPEQPAIDRY